jgi:hypothetical protein
MKTDLEINVSLKNECGAFRTNGRAGALLLGPRGNSIRGGEGEIRTHGTRKGSTVFETAAFDHSATSPLGQRNSRAVFNYTSRKLPNYHPRTYAKTSGATIEASDSITYLGVSMLSFSQVIFSLGMAPE